MSARGQLKRLVEELDEEQAERALAVLESAADWVLTADRADAGQRPPVAVRRVPGDAALQTLALDPVHRDHPRRSLHTIGAAGGGRHRGR